MIALLTWAVAFNFSHVISELSFGPYYPSLVNPLDRTINTAEAHFHKFQYYMSVVPTVYSVSGGSFSLPSLFSSSSNYANTKTIFTNQYAVTEQSKQVSDRNVPGLFFKYDIEPILLTVREHRDGVLTFLVKVVNVLSGVLVAAHWGYTLTEWLKETLGKRRARRSGPSEGVIGSKGGYGD